MLIHWYVNLVLEIRLTHWHLSLTFSLDATEEFSWLSRGPWVDDLFYLFHLCCGFTVCRCFLSSDWWLKEKFCSFFEGLPAVSWHHTECQCTLGQCHRVPWCLYKAESYALCLIGSVTIVEVRYERHCWFTEVVVSFFSFFPQLTSLWMTLVGSLRNRGFKSLRAAL